jgi:lipid A ethanolaminephosphotransferase
MLKLSSGAGATLAPAPTFEIRATVEQVAIAAALFWTVVANRPFFAAALQDRATLDPSALGFGFALAVMLLAGHVALLLTVVNRWTVKPLLALITLVTAIATYAMDRFGIYLDPSMLRNVLHTDLPEARELADWALLPHLLLYAGLPLLLLHRVRIVTRPPLRTLVVRAAVIAAAAWAFATAAVTIFQPAASLMRNHKEVRYLITPANWMWSLATVALRDARGAAGPRRTVGEDASPGPTWAAQSRPRLLVLVVGETARSANWGLNRYTRQTTPELAGLDVVNFSDVRACGTSTEVSLPCMFAPVGRRDYDEDRIRHSESLLHVLARARVDVQWRDNQSGCKGVCDGLPFDSVASSAPAALCSDGHCLDEALLVDVDRRLESLSGNQVLVLHMLGNHGPSYFRRYPSAFARFQPACESDDLRACSQQEIVNAYDNAILYSDHVLATLIRRLQAHADRVDSAMVFVSDHGESLGEHNLYLHGIPYPIAPAEQTRVPMVLWTSTGFARTASLDAACLRQRAAQPASHDNLFHTVIGLMDVRTAAYEQSLDLTAECRTGADVRLQASAR